MSDTTATTTDAIRQVLITITRDVSCEGDDIIGAECNRAGKEFTITRAGGSRFAIGPKVEFRTKDDDGNIGFEGWLIDDADTYNQECMRDYAASDHGDTTIEVKRGRSWVQDLA